VELGLKKVIVKVKIINHTLNKYQPILKTNFGEECSYTYCALKFGFI
jgi:hypothetical protein